MQKINLIKRDLKRIIRGIKYLFHYLLFEKPKGLDFSLRNKKMNISDYWNHGYAMTEKGAFDNIIKRIPISENSIFIDIGCGKGGCFGMHQNIILSKYMELKLKNFYLTQQIVILKF